MTISADLAARLGPGPARRRWGPYARPHEDSRGGAEPSRPPRRFNPAAPTRSRAPAKKAAPPGSGRQPQVAPSFAAPPGPAQKAAMAGPGRRSGVASSVAPPPPPPPAGRRPWRKMITQKEVTPGSGIAASVPAASGSAQKEAMGGSEVATTAAAATIPAAPAPAGPCPGRDMTSQKPKNPASEDEKSPAEEKCSSGGGGFILQATLEGHSEAISGISLPMGSDKLYTGSADGSVRVWDCNSGKCVDVIKMEGKIGCMTTYGTWVFIGIPKSIEAWNSQTGMKLSLKGPTCLVCSMTIANDILFAGMGDGRIMAWDFRPKEISFEPVVILSGHERPVVSVSASEGRLFSGSLDKTIKVWDLTTLQCVQTLYEHTAGVTSVLCWDQKLLSCSLDKTVKVWTISESGALKVQYNHAEDYGLRTIFGMHRVGSTPILLCSLRNSNCIRLCNLPSFSQLGTLSFKSEVRIMELGEIWRWAPPGAIASVLLFTGDSTGELKVWRWAPQEEELASASPPESAAQHP